jgi:hypothetical protein
MAFGLDLRRMSAARRASLLERFAGRRRKSAGPYRYVFIVTYARSGSTVLQKILGSIDGFYVAGENGGSLFGLFQSYQAARAARVEQGNEPRRDLGDPWRGIDRIDPERYGRALADVFVNEIIQPPPNARVIGFKEVRYFDCLDVLDELLAFMQRAFAPSLIVFNKRNATAVAQSAWWRSFSTPELVTEIERFDRLMEAYVERHRADALIVDYDEYCRDVQALGPLFERLGEPFNPTAVRAVFDVRLRH